MTICSGYGARASSPSRQQQVDLQADQTPRSWELYDPATKWRGAEPGQLDVPETR